MAKLSAAQITQLGDHFTAIAGSVGQYRIANSSILTKEQNAELKKTHANLLNIVDEFYTTSALMAMEQAEASLKIISDVAKGMDDTLARLKNVQKTIDIAASAVKLAASVFTKNPGAVAGALSKLVKSCKQDSGGTEGAKSTMK